MENYNFWADLLSTFRSMPDWIKALWPLVPPVFVLACVALVLSFLRRDVWTLGCRHFSRAVMSMCPKRHLRFRLPNHSAI